MAANANSVNIAIDAEGPRIPYHHGDLRSALVAAGMVALDGRPAEDLSLRALAREAGVSATAVYRHFPDKDALLGALALASLDRMGAAQAAAMAQTGAEQGAHAAFCASGAAYVRFAINHPNQFRLIWQMAPASDVLSEPLEQSHPAMQGLRRSVDAVLPTDASAEDRRALALRCWGLVHGLAMLALDRQVSLDDAMIDRVIEGLIPRP